MSWALQDFAPLVGETFTVEAGDAAVPLTLELAQEIKDSPRPQGGFRLQFVGPGDLLLPQAIYTFVRDGETREIFIVPVERSAAGLHYEAVFF
jgi:hypothetical protein